MGLSLESNSQTGSNSSDTTSFKRGEIVYREGDPIRGFYILKSGKVAVVKKRNKRITPSYTATAKQMIGENSSFGSSDFYEDTAVVLNDCKLIFIDKDLIDNYLHEGREWMRNLLELFATRLNHTSEIIAENHVVHEDLYAGLEYSNEEEAFIKNVLKVKA